MLFEGAFSPVRWLIIAVVALLLGPELLADTAKKLGRVWREYQNARMSFADHIDEALGAEGRADLHEHE